MSVAKTSKYRAVQVLALLALVSLLLSTPMRAQTKPDPLERIVPVSVMTERGEVVKGLTPDRFRASIGHHAVQVASADESPPHRVVLLFDTSGSMIDIRPIALVVAQWLVGHTPERVPLGMLTFGEAVKDRVALTADHTVVRAALQRLGAATWGTPHGYGSGGTALWDALGAGADLLGQPMPGDAVVIVSDGNDNASRAGSSKTFRRLEMSGIRVFSFLPVESLASRGRTPEENVGPEGLHALGEHTAGDSWSFEPSAAWDYNENWPPAKRANAQERLAEQLTPVTFLVQEINDFYLLQIRLPELVEKPEKWKLEVVDPATGKPDHHLILHYPSQLMPLPGGGP